ncbi:primase-like DNA-binding domain-containing protein [Streptomyces sp. NPDC048723]|uniref:primase-like DNA-binding domain-containing protein n=1 Tax=Streptomyces sp. NPDC048723 TaxID=3365589 RepID=UPI003712DF0F
MATSAYAETEDHTGRFFEECCTFHADHRAEQARLYSVYRTWCQNEGAPTISSAEVADGLADTDHSARGRLGEVLKDTAGERGGLASESLRAPARTAGGAVQQPVRLRADAERRATDAPGYLPSSADER